jgi:bacterioferritin
MSRPGDYLYGRYRTELNGLSVYSRSSDAGSTISLRIFHQLPVEGQIMNKGKKAAHAGFDIAAIRTAAKNFEDGAVTAGYQADHKKVVALLNGALATELVCVLRYMRHYHTANGLQNGPIKAEFLQHAQEEQGHADMLAERIVQLNGLPDFNPGTLTERSHAEYDDSKDVQAMIKANLIAERVAIESYRQMIEVIGDADPTTRQMLVTIMMVEEEHADDMRDLLA